MTDRTQDARDHDDSDMIDNIITDAGVTLRSGGNLARSVGTEADTNLDDPDDHARVTKEDAIDAGEASRSARRPDS